MPSVPRFRSSRCEWGMPQPSGTGRSQGWPRRAGSVQAPGERAATTSGTWWLREMHSNKAITPPEQGVLEKISVNTPLPAKTHISDGLLAVGVTSSARPLPTSKVLVSEHSRHKVVQSCLTRCDAVCPLMVRAPTTAKCWGARVHPRARPGGALGKSPSTTGPGGPHRRRTQLRPRSSRVHWTPSSSLTDRHNRTQGGRVAPGDRGDHRRDHRRGGDRGTRRS